jgi:hypothetical protein
MFASSPTSPITGGKRHQSTSMRASRRMLKSTLRFPPFGTCPEQDIIVSALRAGWVCPHVTLPIETVQRSTLCLHLEMPLWFYICFCLRHSSRPRPQPQTTRAAQCPGSGVSNHQALEILQRNQAPLHSQTLRTRRLLRHRTRPHPTRRQIVLRASKPSACLGSFQISRPWTPTQNCLR